MSDTLASVLFQSTTRTRLLEFLFVREGSGSVSELARRFELSPRAVANEVRHLLPSGLVQRESVGNADLIRANLDHPASRHLRALLETSAVAQPKTEDRATLAASLAGWGAPLAQTNPAKHLSLHETLLRGLESAREDGTTLRVLPLVLAKNLSSLDWVTLREDARKRKLKAELGFLADLSASLLGSESVRLEAEPLKDRRATRMRFFPEVKSSYEGELTKKRTPQVARKWGFWMNVSEDSFRTVFEKHHAQVHH